MKRQVRERPLYKSTLTATTTTTTTTRVSKGGRPKCVSQTLFASTANAWDTKRKVAPLLAVLHPLIFLKDKRGTRKLWEETKIVNRL